MRRVSWTGPHFYRPRIIGWCWKIPMRLALFHIGYWQCTPSGGVRSFFLFVTALYSGWRMGSV